MSSVEELSFLSAQSKLALLSLGHSVAQEVANSRTSKDFETIGSRQAHYITWCKSNHIMDPIGPEPEWDYVIAIYIKSVMLGVNYWNKYSVRSATRAGYALAVEKLFTLRNVPSPVDFLTRATTQKRS